VASDVRGGVVLMIHFHKHRIVPGHMGGTYDARNVIRVNVAMHAFLHKCLWEQHGDTRDFHAWKMLTSMIGKDHIASMVAGIKAFWADEGKRRDAIIALRERTMGHPVSDETRAKLREWHLGRPNTNASKEKNRVASTGRTHSAEAKEKIRAANTGQRRTSEQRARIRAARLAYLQRKRDERVH
jgi:hypothetical protein